MNRNLVKSVLDEGGSVVPLLISPNDLKGPGLMNPSIFLDGNRILLNLRNINYTLYHCEGSQLFNNRWGPLSYLHPENDMHLRTWNFMCDLNPQSLEIQQYKLTDTASFDKEPLWDFVGLEDARLVRWNGKLYQCGVRRDTTPNGQGRMELTEIVEQTPGKGDWKEVSRTRVEPPGEPTYCEKNWMPVIDMPYHFVKWTNPTQVVKVNMNTKQSETVFLGLSYIDGIRDLRGGSQVITWRDHHICLLHEVNLTQNKLQQKDGNYYHRFIVWDKEWTIVRVSEPFSFMDGEIEFGCGLALYEGDFLCTFGFQDNAAFLLRIPEAMIEKLLGIKLSKLEENQNAFDWGEISHNQIFLRGLKSEVVEKNNYQKLLKVEEGDVVVDVGASVGPFANLIASQKPKHIYCIEPSVDLFPTLEKNLQKYDFVTCINKGIGDTDEDLHHFDRLYGKDYINISGNPALAKSIKFDTFIKEHNIEKIDFLKVDCEGGEYDIFNDENFDWIKKNVKKMVVEFHFLNDEHEVKFKNFRNTYLRNFQKFEVFSLLDQDVKYLLWNDNFTELCRKPTAIIIHIDNR